MKKLFSVLFGLLILSGCTTTKDASQINLRLQWFPHAQFAGYLIAQEKGFYEQAGLDITIVPAGPDIKPATTVANGTDQFGIGVPNQIIAARSNGVPLTIIAQIFQDSPNRYLLKNENRIDSLQELAGRKVGLWLGGDEAEFISMLKSVGMTLEDVDVVPQGFTVDPFLEDQYVLSQVTNYGELNVIKTQGYSEDDFQILSPADYNSAILGDMIFCTEAFLQKNPEIVQKFLEASFQGWQYVLNNPEESLGIVLKHNPELAKDEQELVMATVIELIRTGSHELGFIDHDAYVNIERMLRESKQIEEPVDVQSVYNTEIWQKIPSPSKAVQ